MPTRSRQTLLFRGPDPFPPLTQLTKMNPVRTISSLFSIDQSRIGPGAVFDKIGFLASSLCAVHCLCMPWLILLSPFIAQTWLADRNIEEYVVLGSISLATLCTVGGCRAHRKWWLIGLLAVGAGILFTAHSTAPAICCSKEISWPHALGATLGGGLLATTHFLNMFLQKQEALVAGTSCCGPTGCRRGGAGHSTG